MPRFDDGLKQFVTTTLAAFPDFHFTIEDAIAEGNKLAVRLTARGTHRGPLGDIPPDRKAGSEHSDRDFPHCRWQDCGTVGSSGSMASAATSGERVCALVKLYAVID